ncbi:UDP-glucose:glycoprotein glucosyltransferase [Copidosoma floridanum]|uniref:UDP-glucose:glycoprotein glucosyltransferase n=1 Tax=Copidosoma floridanum TaxID=29053 RepID=UPI000C6F5256|nr:UDP-glucose:glycoprotein glucosyltransferase [Copidosoma floridanum]
MSISKKFLTEARIRLMKLGLSLRIYSAKVEMFFKMAEENTNFFNNCYNFIDVGGEFICDLEEVKLYVENNSSFTSDTYSIDHFYNGKNNVKKTFILYGLIGTSGFLPLHTYLRSLAESNKINYVLRHHAKVRAHQNLRLSGYGVELQIKSTEYKASNDLEVNNNENQSKENTKKEINDASGINFSLLEKLSPVKRKDLNKLQKYVSENIHEVGSLKIWQFQELSHQAAYKIISSLPSEVINVLTEISQNFPMQAKSLLKLKISDEMKKEIKLNQDVFLANLNIQPSDTVLFVNGIFFDVETIDVLELKIMESFYKIGIDKEEIYKLLTLELSTDVDTLDYAIDIRDSAIIWLNDIENDSKYYRWSPYLTELLRPSFPGRIRNVRRNIYNLVLILDPTNKTSLSLISLIESLYSTQLRIGLVFLTNFDMTISGATDASIAINNAFHYFMDNKTPDDAIKFLFSLHNNYSDGLIVNDVEMAVKNIDPKLNLDEIFNKESDYDVGRRLAKDFIEKTGFKAFPQALFNGVPLSTKLENVDILKETILSMVMSQTLMIQKAIIRGEVTEDDDVVDFLMNQTNVLPRFNERILKPKENCWLNTVGSIPENTYYEKWNSEDLTAWMIKNLQYLYAPKKTAQYHLYTLWLTIDLHLISGRKLLKEALDYLKSNADVRLSVILYDSKLHESKVNINKIALAAISALNVKKSYKYIYDLISGDTFQSISNGTFLIEDSAIQQNLQNQEFVLQVHNYFSSKVLGVQDSNNVIVYNGRIIGPLRENEEFTSEDFTLLERLSHNFYGDKIFNFILKNDFFKNSNDFLNFSKLKIIFSDVRYYYSSRFICDIFHNNIT